MMTLREEIDMILSFVLDGDGSRDGAMTRPSRRKRSNSGRQRAGRGSTRGRSDERRDGMGERNV